MRKEKSYIFNYIEDQNGYFRGSPDDHKIISSASNKCSIIQMRPKKPTYPKNGPNYDTYHRRKSSSTDVFVDSINGEEYSDKKAKHVIEKKRPINKTTTF
ncbi:MAG: hypothetical protein ACOC1O_06490 [bacterium]